MPTPRLESRPSSVGGYGQRVIDFCLLVGVCLDDWQQYVVHSLFEVTAEGEWASTEFGLLVARQNGKGEILVGYDLAHLFLFPRDDNRRKTILHTAHEMKTTVDAFERLVGVIQAQPILMRRVRRIYTANGKEAIELKPRNGQLLGDRIRFIARSKNSGRGFSADIIVADEAQELPAFAQDALTYTQTTIANRQQVFFGTVPSEINDAEVFEGVRDRGRGQKHDRTGWMEWSPPGSEDPKLAPQIDLADMDTWAASNPGVGLHGFFAAVIAEQLERTTDPDAFARERCSIWPNRAEEEEAALSDLDLDQWNDNAVDGIAVGPGPVIAIALGNGGGFATVAIASRKDAGFVVEHKETRAGTMWVADHVKRLREEIGAVLVVLDEKNASAILTNLKTVGVAYLPMNPTEVAGAHAVFIEYSNAGMVWHRGQAEVAKSLRYATTRKVGSAGLTWEPSDPTKPISHAQAVTWAVWGVTKSEANPARTPAPVRGYA